MISHPTGSTLYCYPDTDGILGNLPTWVPQPCLPGAENSISLPNAPSRLDSTPDLTHLYMPSLPTALLGCGRPALHQGMFPIQGLNPGLQLCRWALYHLNYDGSPTCTAHLHFPHVSALPSRLDMTGQMPHTHHISPQMSGVSYWGTILACDLSHMMHVPLQEGVCWLTAHPRQHWPYDLPLSPFHIFGTSLKGSRLSFSASSF